MNLDRAILLILQRSSGPNRTMSRNALWAELVLDHPRTDWKDFLRALATLQSKGQAAILDGEDRVKVRILDDGLLRLAD